MKHQSSAEKILIQEVVDESKKLKLATRGLSIGSLIKLIRQHMGMSQKTLAKRAGVPQSTVSRIEQGQRDVSLSTLTKILDALSCDLVISPVLRESIEMSRRRQARKMAEKRIHYLKGTMNLEDQQPDAQFTQTLLLEEEARLLQGPDYKLWEE
ncbi:MAG: helix-turn-helix domain-containing protein [Parachlamydiaceae bacterium]